MLNAFMGSLKSISLVFSKNYFIIFGEQSYRPLVTLSHIFDTIIWGKNATAHHLVNLVLHICSVLLVYRLLKKLTIFKTTTTLLATILFAVHPLHLETLSVVAYRADLLMTLFLVMGMLCYLRIKTTGSLLAGIGMIICFTASLFSKETGASLLLLILAYEFFCKNDKERNMPAFFFFGTLVIILGAYLWCRFFFLVHPQDYLRSTTFTESIPLPIRPIYIALLAIRVGICPAPIIIEFANKSTLYPLVIQGVAILGIGLYIFRNAWGSKAVRYACALAFIPLLSVSQVYPLENFFASRYMYLPSIGFSLLIALAVNSILPRHRINVLLGLMLVIFFSSMSISGLTFFSSPTAFARKLIADLPESYKAYNYLGTIELKNNSLDSAIAFFKQAVTINPDYYEATYNLGAIYLKTDQFDLAEPLIKHVIKLNPNRSEGYSLMGDLLFTIDQLDKAESFYNKALQNNPLDMDVRNNLGILYETQGRLDEAANLYLSILKVNKSFPLAWANLGNINIARKDYDLACQSYLNALEIEPENAQTWYNLGNAYFYQQKWQKAQTCYTQAIKLDRSFADPLYNLAAVHVYQRQFDKAIELLRKYLSFRPEDEEAQTMLETLRNR